MKKTIEYDTDFFKKLKEQADNVHKMAPYSKLSPEFMSQVAYLVGLTRGACQFFNPETKEEIK